MGQFNLTRPFAGVMQSMPFPDPFAGEVTFWVRPLSYGPYQSAVEAAAGSSGSEASIMQRALGRASKRYALQTGPAAALVQPANGDGTDAPPPMFQDLVAQAFREVVEETPEERFSARVDRAAEDALPPERAALLVERVEGLINAANELAGVDEVPALLADPTVIPPGYPYAGQAAGWALRLWLVERAREVEKTIAAAVTAAGKASEPSSDGDSPSLPE